MHGLGTNSKSTIVSDFVFFQSLFSLTGLLMVVFVVALSFSFFRVRNRRDGHSSSRRITKSVETGVPCGNEGPAD